MIQLLPHEEALISSSTAPADAVNYINAYIEKHSCENMSIDISFMNILDACYVSTLCSTKHYIKYPEGKISWKVSSELVKEFNKDLELGNSIYSL
jgi:hypothetical protein